MKKVYTLATCDRCKKILKATNPTQFGFEIHDVKSKGLTADQISDLMRLSNSPDQLINKSSRPYKSLGLKDKTLDATELTSLLIEDYALLRRPLFITDSKIAFGGKSDQTDELDQFLAAAK